MPAMRHRHTITASADDIDELGHVSNVVYLRWVLDAAIRHSTTVGWAPSAYVALGSVLVVRRHELDYLAQVLEGDALEIETWVEDWRGASVLRRTTMTRVRDGALVTRAATKWAFIDLASGRPQRIPEELRVAFGAIAA
jgi:acyl-CoA thioester hydrolase